MSRTKAVLRRKCRSCTVAGNVGGCLFGCTSKEKLARELDILIQAADSRADPMMEQLKACPEAFTAGKTMEHLFQLVQAESHNNSKRHTPPRGTVVSPFV